jgi:hypothetical protein
MRDCKILDLNAIIEDVSWRIAINIIFIFILFWAVLLIIGLLFDCFVYFTGNSSSFASSKCDSDEVEENEEIWNEYST